MQCLQNHQTRDICLSQGRILVSCQLYVLVSADQTKNYMLITYTQRHIYDIYVSLVHPTIKHNYQYQQCSYFISCHLIRQIIQTNVDANKDKYKQLPYSISQFQCSMLIRSELVSKSLLTDSLWLMKYMYICLSGFYYDRFFPEPVSSMYTI